MTFTTNIEAIFLIIVAIACAIGGTIYLDRDIRRGGGGW